MFVSHSKRTDLWTILGLFMYWYLCWLFMWLRRTLSKFQCCYRLYRIVHFHTTHVSFTQHAFTESLTMCMPTINTIAVSHLLCVDVLYFIFFSLLFALLSLHRAHTQKQCSLFSVYISWNFCIIFFLYGNKNRLNSWIYSSRRDYLESQLHTLFYFIFVTNVLAITIARAREKKKTLANWMYVNFLI